MREVYILNPWRKLWLNQQNVHAAENGLTSCTILLTALALLLKFTAHCCAQIIIVLKQWSSCILAPKTGGSFASTGLLEGVIHICIGWTFIGPLHYSYLAFCFSINLNNLKDRAIGKAQTCASLNVGLSILLRSVPSGLPSTTQMKVFWPLRPALEGFMQ